jgi:hypothetical protein
MSKYGTISNTINKYNLTYNNNYFNEEISKNIDNLESNIYQHYNNSSLNYYEIKNIIRNEFAELILPYQKQVNNFDNIVQQKINLVESNLKGIIDSKSFENMNHTAQMINMFMKNQNFGNNNNTSNNINNINNSNINFNKSEMSNSKNNNSNINNLESKLNLKLKNEYDKKIDIIERQINSMNSLLKTLKETFDSNMLDIFKNQDNNKSYTEKSEYEKYKTDINIEIKKIKEEQKKIKSINETLEKLINNVNELSILNNDNKYLFSNEINSLKDKYENINEIFSNLKGKINNNQFDKLLKLNLDSLQSINIYEINEMKEKIKSINDNVDDLYERLKSNDKNINNINNKNNELEQNLNYINKDVEFLNKQNLTFKIDEINKKLEEYFIRNNTLSNQNDDKDNDNNIKESNNDEIENDNILGIKGSRRQKRNSTKIKNLNLNLDENMIKILKQIENIDFDNINKRLDELSNENKMLISKIETNNDNFMNINEQENIINQKIEELNKKIKESENRLYLLELKNYGNVNENQNEEEKEEKEIKSPFSPINSNSNNNINNKSIKRDSKLNEKSNNNSNIDLNMNNLDNLINENNNMKINMNKSNENELLEKIMKEENNDYKQKNSFGLNDKSYKESSISGIIKHALDDDKKEKNNENNDSKFGDKSNNDINDIDYEDFDDI